VEASVLATRAVATVTLDLALTSGGSQVTPRQDIVTGVRHHDNALRRLRTQLDEAAATAFESDGFVVEELDFRKPAAGSLTAVLSVATTAERVETTRFAVGVTGLGEAARRPLEAFLTEIGDDSSVEVTVNRSFVERQEPEPAAEELPPSLTRDQQTLARVICGVAFVAIAVFVILVLAVT
jgi:hypothetical protein